MTEMTVRRMARRRATKQPMEMPAMVVDASWLDAFWDDGVDGDVAGLEVDVEVGGSPVVVEWAGEITVENVERVDVEELSEVDEIGDETGDETDDDSCKGSPAQ
jgi:hypothetical protein